MALIIGTRGSDLALWQANYAQEKFRALGIESEIRVIKTSGDLNQETPLNQLTTPGFFTKEIEKELLEGRIDLAVHSYKDLETTVPEGLDVPALIAREDPREAILIRPECADDNLPFGMKEGAIVGTSSNRRAQQLKMDRPDVEIRTIRGNVPTRVNKLRDGEYESIICARAGLVRLELDLSDFKVIVPSVSEFVPASGQGVLAIETRTDGEGREAALKLNEFEISILARVERQLLSDMGGGCTIPFGANLRHDGMFYCLEAFLGPQEGEKFAPFRVSTEAGGAGQAHAVGIMKLKEGRGF